MGEVYRARQISRNRPVAIKMMIANSTAGEKAMDYFHREIQALRDMLMPGGKCHPSIVEFYELFQVEGQFQLVMEYVDGKNAPGMGASAPGGRCRSPVGGPDRPAVARRRSITPIPGATSTATSSRRTCWSWARSIGPASSSRTSAWPRASAEQPCLRRPDPPGRRRRLDRASSRPITSASSARSRSRPTSTAPGPPCSTCSPASIPSSGSIPRRPDSYEMILENPPVPLPGLPPGRPRGPGADPAQGPPEAARATAGNPPGPCGEALRAFTKPVRA